MVKKCQPLRAYMYEHIYPHRLDELITKLSDNLKCSNISHSTETSGIICIYTKTKKTDFKETYNANFDPKIASQIIANTIQLYITDLYQSDIDFRKYIDNTYNGNGMIPAKEKISLFSILFTSNNGIIHIRL